MVSEPTKRITARSAGVAVMSAVAGPALTNGEHRIAAMAIALGVVLIASDELTRHLAKTDNDPTNDDEVLYLPEGVDSQDVAELATQFGEAAKQFDGAKNDKEREAAVKDASQAALDEAFETAREQSESSPEASESPESESQPEEDASPSKETQAEQKQAGADAKPTGGEADTQDADEKGVATESTEDDPLAAMSAGAHQGPR